MMAYWKQHGCWGLVVVAGCYDDCSFNILSCMHSGETNDTLALISKASTFVEGDGRPEVCCVMGDNANKFLTPY